MSLPHGLLMELRMAGFQVSIKPPLVNEDSKSKSDLKLVVEGDAPIDVEKIREAAVLLKLLILLEDLPHWLLRQMRLVEDPGSPVTLPELTAAVAYHVGGLERWQEVFDEVRAALESLLAQVEEV